MKDIERLLTEPIFFERNRVYRIYKGGLPYKQFFNDGFDDGVDNFFPEEWIASSVKAINPKYFACMEVALPSIDRQSAIADLNALALKEGRLLRRLADEKKRYCDFIINTLQTDDKKGL